MENITLEKINFVNGSAGKTPLNSNNMNAIQQNTENAINEVVPIITGIEENTENNNSDIAEAKINIENNTNNILEINNFIKNSMKTLSEEGTSIHVEDSADYPCKLEIEGKSEQTQTEQGKNLLPFKDINFTLKGVNFYTENGNLYLNGASTGEILTNDNAYITYFSFILPVGTYKFKHFSSLNVNMAIQLKNVSDKSELASINLNSNTVKTFTLNEETEVYLGIYIYNQNFNNENLKLMLSIEDATEYEPFVPDSPSPDYPSSIENVEGDLEIKVVAKNLMPSDLEKYTYNNGTYGFFKISGQARDLIMSLTEKNADIDLSGCSFGFTGNGINAEEGFRWLVSNGVVYSNGKINNSRTLGEMMYVSVWPNNQLTLEKIFNRFNIQVEEGDTATEYEPYKEQTVTFPFSEGQKLMQGGYLGENGVVNKRKQVVFNGTENWGKWSTYFLIELNNSYYNNIQNSTGRSYCNKYKEYGSSLWNDTNLDIEYGYLINYGSFYIRDVTFTTVEELKAWLAEQYTNGTPVIVEYEMQEEETTAYTSEQQTAYNTLQKFKTYRTTTNISNNQDTNMKLTYKKDLQTQFQELETMLLESGV